MHSNAINDSENGDSDSLRTGPFEWSKFIITIIGTLSIPLTDPARMPMEQLLQFDGNL